MNWNALDVITALLGIVGVISALVYLALQLRERNKRAQYEGHTNARMLIAEHQKILTDPDCARIWLQGLSEPETLSREEKLRFYNMMYILMNSIELQHLNPAGSYHSEVGVGGGLWRYPGFQRFWRNARGNFDQGMMLNIDRQLESYRRESEQSSLASR